ncbi:MAG: 6-bladed beta-propeller [Emcibacteraceae bacterium]|nr:6-bladed beta-propeller [Emcibacteraceae bacterium]
MSIKKVISVVGFSIALIAVLLIALSVVANMTKSLNDDYKIVATWKGVTQTSEQFTYPTGMKIYNDQVYVVDTNEHMIKVFDLDGNFIRQFGKQGSELGEFNRPWNIFFTEGELFVAGYQSHKIDVFDPDGTYKRSFGSFGDGDGELNGPTALDQDANGDLIIAELFGHRVSRFKTDGTFLSVWGDGGDGGRAVDNFKYPFDIATSPDKDLIYILDTANERVKVYGADGEYKFRWGGPFAYNMLFVWYNWFPFDGWFADPKAIVTDDSGNVYVGDSGNKRVQVFDKDGNHITSFGGTGEDEFAYIAGMDFSSDGSLYIVDESRKVVQKWQYQPNQ